MFHSCSTLVRWVSLCGLTATLSLSSGCIAAGATLAVMAVGSAIRDAEVKEIADELKGRDETAADRMFGPRLETLIVMDDSKRELLLYTDAADPTGETRYAVELQRGKVAEVSKNKFEVDRRQIATLFHELHGKTPEECERTQDLKAPEMILQSVERNQDVRVYDSSLVIDGSRFLVLRFNTSNECINVNIVEPRGTSRKKELIDLG
ncbi:MAG: hypothetical protein ACPGXK_02705 [Phycisphaerae bacterium]